MKNQDKPLCFVVQGFGSKTDYTDGRVLDLDASYDVIKQAVEKAGMHCERADEIVHAGTIDIPMYERLLEADLVIADLSTNNLNAAFELGVRYALRPRATIVVAESKFKSPFDVNHIVIRRYEHLGADLGAKEARRFEKDLAATIKQVMKDGRNDSPVYAMLPGLSAPAMPARAAHPPAAAAPPDTKAAPARSMRDWLELAQKSMAAENYAAAIPAWAELRRFNPSDTRATQQLALATYRARRPNEAQALDDAQALLATLDPATTNDPETLGLWGAIHQRRWDRVRSPADLAEAIGAYERAHVLKLDHYNAAQLALLLLARAARQLRDGHANEALADRTQAHRTWREAQRLAEDVAGNTRATDSARYWASVTLWEAAIGLGDAAAERRWSRRVRASSPRAATLATRESHARRLQALVDELDRKLPPPPSAAPPPEPPPPP